MNHHNTLRPLGIGVLGVYVVLIAIGVIAVILN